MKKSTSPPWIDADIMHLSNKKNTLWRKFKRFGTVFLKDKLRKLTNKLKNLVEYKYYNYICDVSSDILYTRDFGQFFDTKLNLAHYPLL